MLFKHVPIYTNRRSSKKKRLVAEIDVIAFKDGFYDIFEVKCSRRITKARKQLFRIRKALSPDRQLRDSFFYCGESGELENVR